MGRTVAQRRHDHRVERFFRQHGTLAMDWLTASKRQGLMAHRSPAELREEAKADADKHMRKGGE